MKRLIYFIFLLFGFYVSVFHLNIGHNYAIVIGLLGYVFIFKPLCDMFFLKAQYNCKIKETIKMYPFFSRNIMMKLYFGK